VGVVAPLNAARTAQRAVPTRFRAPMHAQKRKEGNPRSRRRESAHLFAFEAKDQMPTHVGGYG